MQQRVKRQVRLRKTPLLVLLAMIIVIIGIIVTSFVVFLGESLNAPPPNTAIIAEALSIYSDPQTSSMPLASSGASAGVSSSASNGTSTPAESQKPEAEVKTVDVKTVVPETVPVKSDYFKDAIFIGDSISKGLKTYGVLPDNNVIAEQNVGLDQIYNNKDVYYISAKEKTTLWKAIEAKVPSPKKIYVLLGSNGIPSYENDKQMQYYSDLIDKLIEKFPQAVIYIESVTPITKDSEYIRKTFTTEKINDFNKKLLPLAEEKGVFYLDIQSVLKDKDGFLKKEYAASDGMHMQKTGHEAVYKYFKTHTVDINGKATVKVEAASAQPLSSQAPSAP